MTLPLIPLVFTRKIICEQKHLSKTWYSSAHSNRCIDLKYSVISFALRLIIYNHVDKVSCQHHRGSHFVEKVGRVQNEKFWSGKCSHKTVFIFAEENEYLTSRPAWARDVVMGRFQALRISHNIIFWFGVSRMLRLYFSIISLNVFFIFPPIRPLSTWSPQNKPPSPCWKFYAVSKKGMTWGHLRQWVRHKVMIWYSINYVGATYQI